MRHNYVSLKVAMYLFRLKLSCLKITRGFYAAPETIHNPRGPTSTISRAECFESKTSSVCHLFVKIIQCEFNRTLVPSPPHHLRITSEDGTCYGPDWTLLHKITHPFHYLRFTCCVSQTTKSLCRITKPLL